MRHTAFAAALSWIPSHAMTSVAGRAIDLGIAHVDAPPPGRIDGAEAVHRLRDADRFRFANVAGIWAEAEGGRIVDSGIAPDAGLVMGSTMLRLGPLGVTFPAVSLPLLRETVLDDPGSVTLVQTAGGRTGAPLPRAVPRPPFVQWWAPLVWTTVSVTLTADGSASARLTGASAFPRHWLYGTDGALAAKSGVTEERRWLDESFGERTPWGMRDEAPIVSAIESELEHRLSAVLMSGAHPVVRRIAAGDVLTEQGEPGDDLLLLLDGILRVTVNGEVVAEVGPGAVLGERALLEGGRRTATLTAVTPARVAVAPGDAIDRDSLVTLARGHRREDASGAGGGAGGGAGD